MAAADAPSRQSDDAGAASSVARPRAALVDPRGVLAAAGWRRAVLRGATVRHTRSSHALACVRLDARRAVVVKQAPPDARERGRSLGAELFFYRLAHHRRALARLAPRALWQDEARQWLVLEKLGAGDGWPEAVPARDAATVGAMARALATLHRHTHRLPLAVGEAQGVLGLPDHLDSACVDRGDGAVAVMHAVAAEPLLADTLRTARRGLTCDAMTHGDVRAENWARDARGRLKLLDWELGGGGDRGWDLGSLCAQHRVDSIGIGVQLPLDRADALDAEALAAYAAALRGSALRAPNRSALARMTAARLVHRAIECAEPLGAQALRAWHVDALLTAARQCATRARDDDAASTVPPATNGTRHATPRVRDDTAAPGAPHDAPAPSRPTRRVRDDGLPRAADVWSPRPFVDAGATAHESNADTPQPMRRGSDDVGPCTVGVSSPRLCVAGAGRCGIGGAGGTKREALADGGASAAPGRGASHVSSAARRGSRPSTCRSPASVDADLRALRRAWPRLMASAVDDGAPAERLYAGWYAELEPVVERSRPRGAAARANAAHGSGEGAARCDAPQAPAPSTLPFEGLLAASLPAGRWQRGWVCVGAAVASHEVDDGVARVLAARAGRLRSLTRTECVNVARPGLPPAPGDALAVRARVAWVDAATGYFVVHGERGEPTSALLRAYWSVDASALPSLLPRVVEALERCGVRWSLKCPSNAEACARRDALVVYVAAADGPALVPRLTALARAHRALLRDASPRLAWRAARGLAFARDPGHGVSFGQRVCQVLAAAHVARGAAAPTLPALRAALAAGGIDPRCPWAAPDGRHAAPSPLAMAAPTSTLA